MANYDLFIFAGHGEGDCGAVGNGFQEHERCVVLAKKVVEHLKSKGLSVHYGVQNYNNNLTKGNTYSKKFGFSFHLNSASASAKGIEIIVPLKEKDFTIESEILSEMVKLGFTSRGLKSRNYDTEAWSSRKNGSASTGKDYYREIREAWSNGFSLSIIESCFISNADDIKRFNANIDKIALIYANAILKYLNLGAITPATPTGVKYRVICGSYSSKANAEAQVERLKKAGFSSFLLSETVNSVLMYRVVCGSYSSKANAEAQVKKLAEAGFNAFVLAYN